MNFEAAIEQLTISAETCENNAPINQAEGNLDQAGLERSNAEGYRSAIAMLERCTTNTVIVKRIVDGGICETDIIN